MAEQVLTAQTAPPAPAAGSPATAQPRRRFWSRAWFHRTVTWGAILVAWQLFAMAVGDYFWPPIASIAEGFFTVLRDGSLALVLQSFQQMLIGFGLAILVGVPTGLLLGTFRSLDRLLRPYVNLLFVTSLSAVLPLLILFFGTGFEFRVAVVFLFAVFYVVINPANGVRSIDPNLVDMGESFGARPVKRFFAITMPGTLPFIVSGVRLGLGQAVQGMIIAELWVSLGTGRRLKALSGEHALGEFFALAAIVVLVGTVLAQVVLWLERRVTPWAADPAAQLKGGS